MNQAKLPLVERAVSQALDAGRIPGAVVLVARDGALAHSDARGTDEGGHPLRPDTVLWLASLTKPVCAATLLMLADEGRLAIDDPVSRYIPEFAEPGRVRAIRPGTPPPPPSMPFGPPPDPLPVTVGAFGWDGVTTRRFWVDPSGWTLFMYVPDQEVQRDIEAAVAEPAG